MKQGGGPPDRVWSIGWPRSSPNRMYRGLLDVAGPLHLALHRFLRRSERGIDGGGAGECRRELLADGGAEALELRDRGVLHADIRHRLHGRMVGIGRVDGVDGELRERRRL